MLEVNPTARQFLVSVMRNFSVFYSTINLMNHMIISANIHVL